MLLQDYEELVKKCETKSRQSEVGNFKEKLTFEDDRWSRLTSSEEDTPHLEATSSGKDFYEDNPLGPLEDVGQTLVVSVHHFPMILCPFSPRVFVLPSEGSVAEACLSFEHEDSLSPGLPPIRTGSFSDGDDVPPAATLTANFLYHLAAKVVDWLKLTYFLFFLFLCVKSLFIIFLFLPQVSNKFILPYSLSSVNHLPIFFPPKIYLGTKDIE